MSGLNLIKVDRFGPAYSLKSVINTVAAEVESPTGAYITRGVKAVSVDLNHAVETLNEAERTFGKAIDSYQAKATALSTIAKKVLG